MNLERLRKFLMYLLIFALEFVVIVALLIWMNDLADTTWIWSRQ